MAFLDNLLPGLVTALVTLGLGWMIGNRISENWAIHQKRRELELEANTQFYQLYGEFYAIWKLWNYSLKTPGKMETLTGGEISLPEQTRWNLLERALLAEGKVEAILVKLASEYGLSKGDIETLGLFRKGYQQLRKAIAANRPLDWWSSEVEEYVAFKRLACHVACMLVFGERLLPGNASKRLLQITDNEWGVIWRGRKSSFFAMEDVQEDSDS